MQHIQLIHSHTQGQETIQDIAGTPSSVCIQGLQSATSYRLQAVLFNDGVELAQSNIASFVTLGASAITLTLHNISRENYNYRVHYLFSSTYTISSAVLSCNGQTFQGTIQGNTITFIVTSLTAGNAYLYNVTATDIYGFSETANGSITTTVVNQVNLYYDSRTENTITFSLAYLHDYTFRGGWVNVWNSTQDPSTDVPITNEAWFDGDTQITIPSLSPETTYYFRAGMTVEDAFGSQSTVYSSVVTATTAESTHDYSRDYFTITNEDSAAIDIYLKASNTASGNLITVSVSTDNGSTWSSKQSQMSGNGTLLGTLRAGGKMIVSHSGGMALSDYSKSAWNSFSATGKFSVSGNLTSLTNNIPYVNATMPQNAFNGLFRGATTLVSAENLYFGGFQTVSSHGCYNMFLGCTSLEKSPKLPFILTSSSSHCYYGMFGRCTALKTMPELGSETLAEYCYYGMFSGCTSLVSVMRSLPSMNLKNFCYASMFNGCTALERTPLLPAIEIQGYSYMAMFLGCTSLKKGVDLGHVTSMSSYSIQQMYSGCSSLLEAYAPTVASWNTNYTDSWLKNVSASGTLYADSSIAATIPTDNTSGCPTGWTVQTI